MLLTGPGRKPRDPAGANCRARLEAYDYEPEGTPIERMFSELLSTSMHQDKMNDAHPGYPNHNQTAFADEANILREIALDPRTPSLVMRFDLRGGLAISSVERSEIPSEGLVFRKMQTVYGTAAAWSYSFSTPYLWSRSDQKRGANRRPQFLVVKLTDLARRSCELAETRRCLPT